MKKLTLLLSLFVLNQLSLLSQNYTISGYVSDAKSGETLINSSVFDAKSVKGTVSNSYGFYSITLPKAVVDLEYTYVGYTPENRKFKLNSDTVINISLNESTILNEVTVLGTYKELGVKSSQMSTLEVPVALIKNIPALFGETDVLKALQLLPGVKGGIEGSAGFYVRGGGPDENLFLLDGVPVYNVNHLGGLFSVFNADAIKNVTFYKGSFPARFGGRLSSVLDIRMNEGNNKKLHGNISVGIISSKFNLEGPLLSDKTTFSISGRRTYFDILAQPLLKIASSQQDAAKMSAGYYFYDLNVKVNHKFSDKDRLFLSNYMGDDVIYSDIRDDYKNDDKSTYESRLKLNWNWGNLITALRWNHVLNNKLFMNSTVTFSRYRFNMSVGTDAKQTSKTPPSIYSESASVGYKSGIQDYGAKIDFDYTPNPSHDVKFGINFINHSFRPGVQVFSAKFERDTMKQIMDTTIGDQNIYANEMSVYAEDNFNIGSFIKANIGLHYSNFFVQSEFYQSLQPRIGIRVLLTDQLSFKAGYAAMSQYIHLLSNSNISLPTDLWVPVTKRIEPMKSHQYSGGFFYNLSNIIDISIEAYYKSMLNLIEYKDGATFLGSATGWEDKVSMGDGRAYGVELMAQKSIGKTTGWIGYTWSKADRKFDRPGEEINNGEVFPAKYDRRHDISLVISHKFSPKIDLSGTWVYSTGNSGSLALQNYFAYPVPGEDYNNQSTLPYISKRNNYRLPDYMRIDLGVNFHKQKKHGVRTWNIGVYNVTNQKNPFLVYVSSDYDYNPETQTYTSRKSLKKITIFTILPSISYSYKF